MLTTLKRHGWAIGMLGASALLLVFASCDVLSAFLGGAQAGPSDPIGDKGLDAARQVGEIAEGLHPLVPFIAGVLSGILGDRGQKRVVTAVKQRKAKK